MPVLVPLTADAACPDRILTSVAEPARLCPMCVAVVVFRRGRICANLDIKANKFTGEDVVAYITGAKTQAEYEDVA